MNDRMLTLTYEESLNTYFATLLITGAKLVGP